VCSGAKVILDLPRTLEVLETLGVPVVGYGTSEFPAFYARESGLRLEICVDSPDEAARLMNVHESLGIPSAILFCNPPPASRALSRKEVESLIEDALKSASSEGIQGKRVTPYLLDYLAIGSHGRTLEANIGLLVENARVAAQIAVSYSSFRPA
jgi:pseudouridine-5'-phosphate glycosidase